MARAWLIDSRGIARKVKNASQFSNYQVKDWGAEANRQCPNCNHRIDNSDVSPEWPGLPVGVKFDPSDLELLEHLAGKVGLGNSKPHVLIDEFIPTIEREEGICYTHPENLPGVKKDGSSIHFFHRAAKAYTTGHRKRRKIHKQCNSSGEHVRWHKTGKTRPIIENGIQKGFKKIMVLYKTSKRGSKPDKSNWVMHQYHLGIKEEEEEGNFVVSKVFYQQNQNQSGKNDVDLANQEAEVSTSRASPRTPKANAPHPPRSEKNSLYEDAEEEEQLHLPGQVADQDAAEVEYDGANSAWLAGESQATEDPDPGDIDNWLLCNEILDPSLPVEDLGLSDYPFFLDTQRDNVGVGEDIASNSRIGNPALGNLEFETPPDLDLADLQFGSQDSITSWLDRL